MDMENFVEGQTSQKEKNIYIPNVRGSLGPITTAMGQ